MSIRFVGLALLTGLLLADAAAALAQEPESRAAELAAEQEQKARSLAPYRRGWIERKLLEIEDAGGFGAARGFVVTSGDIKRGSGASLGPAYGQIFKNGTVFQAKAVFSVRNAKVVQASVKAPQFFNHRLAIAARVRWQNAPNVVFHGLAPGVEPINAWYDETQSELSAIAAYRPVRRLRLEAGTGLQRFETSVADKTGLIGAGLFVGVPGVGADPEYLHSFGSAAIDSRDHEGYSRHGSLLRATIHDFNQQNSGPYSFRRFDGAAEHYVPILSGNWVLYFGLHASTTQTGAGESVPHFLLPDLGGSDLRGFSNYRFVDRHSLAVTAEYRWYAQEYLDGAIFYDAGKAVPERSQLDFSDLNHSYGAGIRLHGPRTTLLRIDVARSREGTRLIFAFSPVGG
jgi:hypothetical protein